MKSIISSKNNDFGVIFWQKLANSDDVICTIDMFYVKIYKKVPLPITSVSLECFELKELEKIF